MAAKKANDRYNVKQYDSTSMHEGVEMYKVHYTSPLKEYMNVYKKYVCIIFKIWEERREGDKEGDLFRYSMCQP